MGRPFATRALQLPLREVAGVLLSHPGSFTAHVATATSHSPWQAPDDMPAWLAASGLNSFRYTDQSIQAFVETLRERLPRRRAPGEPSRK